MSENSACVYVSQWQERLGWRLFPQHHFDSPEMDGAHDCFHCTTVVELSFLDRLRALISGKIKVTTKTATEFQIGKSVTASGVNVSPPKFLDRK